MMMMMMHLLST